MTAAERADRTAAADTLCAAAYRQHDGPESGVALVAVGGYGRGELAPFSDLDVVLVHDDDTDVDELAAGIWYPLWDAGVPLDHAVRSLSQMVEAARSDTRVASGLLDLRHLTGDPNLTLRLRTTTLTEWRRDARARLPGLRETVRKRHDLVGELAHLSVPDLKEAEGGIRDAVVLRALVASWLVDVPHTELERTRQELLDVRDLVQQQAGRASDRVTPEAWAPLAEALGLPDERAAQRHVREQGRRMTHLSRLAWRRAAAALSRPASGGAPRRPHLEPVADGVALSSGEIVLHRGARPAHDPVLLLRAATAAAERDVVLAPATAARLARESAPLPDPWPTEARQLMVRLLAAGPGLLGVWEVLEETGALDQVLPEWERIRLLPHASVIHRFTVDRHVVETCVEASSLIREVARPDVLMVAALLHDIGKGGLTEHSVAGEPIARAVARRMGFDAEAVDLVGLLVRWHLLLAETATTRDPDDPATLDRVIERVGTADAVGLLTALTEADAKATSPKAWSSWRAGLVLDLSRRVRARLDTGTAPSALPTHDVPLPAQVPAGSAVVRVEPVHDGARVSVVAPDRVGLLADVAAVLALLRIPVRAARAWGQDDLAVSVWELARDDVDAAIVRVQFEEVVRRTPEVVARLERLDRAQRASTGLAPTVAVRPEASDQATVIEVRATDVPGVVHRVSRVLAELDITVRSAHVSTLGPQAVDVFYVQEASAGALSEPRAAQAAHAVRDRLAPTPES